MSRASKRTGRAKGGATADRRSPLEWVLLAGAAAAILAVVAALVAGGIGAAKGPPELRVTLGGPDTGGGGVTYEVRVRNLGGEPAENVEIDVTVGGETRTVMLSEVTHRNEEYATVVFPAGTAGAAEAAVRSYALAGR